MLQYIVAGLVLGSIYAIASTSLVLTYRASGILNFGFGGIAYGVARTYYYLNTEHGWPSWSAGILCILVISPVLGVLFYYGLLRYLANASTVIRVIVTIGIGVMLPPLTLLIFGNLGVVNAPGLAPQPVGSVWVFGVAVNYDQLIVIACLLLMLIAGFCIMRFTQAGLLVRALVDSPAMTSLCGANTKRISLAVWAVVTGMAGLAGILLAPIVGLSSGNYQVLVAGAFTAILVSKLVNVGRAVIVALFLGIISSLTQYWLPPDSGFARGATTGIPFALIVLFLLWEARRGAVAPPTAMSGHVDRAIRPSNGGGGPGQESALVLRLHYRSGRLGSSLTDVRTIGGIAVIAVVACMPAVLPGFWSSQIALGICFGIVFLSWTLATGEGGMIWLCQISFAGIGASLTAYFATYQDMQAIPAMLLAALIVMPGGLIVGFLTTRLGGLYIALATLALGILIDNLVLSNATFQGAANQGIQVPTPSFLATQQKFVLFALALFSVIALLIEHYRRSTAGMAMTAVRYSEAASRSLGVRVAPMKIALSGAAAFIAAIGGAMLAIYLGSAVPSSYDTITGLVWFAVLVTIGLRSSIAALIAGLSFAVFPAIFQTYLPLSLSNVPAAMFGLGAIMLARNPDGTLAMQVRPFTRYFENRSEKRAEKALGSAPPAEPAGGPGSGLVTADSVGSLSGERP